MPTIKRLKDTTRPRQRKIDTAKRKERIAVYQTPLWKQMRDVQITEHPWCADCESEGRLTPAQDVHHRISFMATSDPCERSRLAFDPDNLVSLCKKCHQKRHNK